MAIDYRTESIDMYKLERWDDSANKYIYIGNGYDDFDILEDDSEVGDAILMQQSNSRGGKFWKVEFEVDTEIIADTIAGVWEYRYIDGSRYGDL